MTRYIKSKTFAWLAFALVIVVLVITFPMRAEWWAFIDIFFAFMAAFINVMAVTLKKSSPIVSKILYKWVLIFAVLWILSFLVEWILLS